MLVFVLKVKETFLKFLRINIKKKIIRRKTICINITKIHVVLIKKSLKIKNIKVKFNSNDCIREN